MAYAFFFRVEHAHAAGVSPLTGETIYDRKGIGLFATRADAEAAIAQVRSAPGFRDFPQGFAIRRERVELPPGMFKGDLREVYMPWCEVHLASEDVDEVLEGGLYPDEGAAAKALETLRERFEKQAGPADCAEVGSFLVGQVCWAEGFTSFDA